MLDDAALRARLEAETGMLTWPELERHFARGVVIRVGGGLDLVDVAAAMARDDAMRVADWLHSGAITRASNEDARAWHDGQTTLRAVVVAPWVVVQPMSAHARD